MPRATYYYRPKHPKADAHGFVDSRDLDEVPQVPQHVPIVTDLYMDGHVAVDGTDIGSRRKRQEYMRETGSLDASDFSRGYFQKEKQQRERAEESATKQSVIESWRRLRKA